MEQQDPGTFRATVVSQQVDADLPNNLIVPDHKLYFAAFDMPDEAHYVCGFLNSHPVRTWLGGFLLGKQIGTTVFEFMKVPQFDPTDPRCQAITEISRAAHKQKVGRKSGAFLNDAIEAQLMQHVQEYCKK